MNWFRKGKDGKFLWPGFQENMRVLEWIFDRVRGQGRGHESSLGWVPRYHELNWEGLDFTEAQFNELMNVSAKSSARSCFPKPTSTASLRSLTKELIFQRELLAGRI